MMKSDNQLKQDIEAELRCDPTINAAEIGVSVDKGAVSLLGAVDTYAEKWAAEDATRRVSGVRTLAQDLTVKIRTDQKRSDSDIAAAARDSLKWNINVPVDIDATVHAGRVKLTGQVTWNYQRHAAELAVRYLRGVVSVDNDITLKPNPTTSEVKAKLEAALRRQALDDSSSIHVEAERGKVTLTGNASSWQAIRDAEHAAWAVSGVIEVDDQIEMVSTD